MTVESTIIHSHPEDTFYCPHITFFQRIFLHIVISQLSSATENTFLCVSHIGLLITILSSGDLSHLYCLIQRMTELLLSSRDRRPYVLWSKIQCYDGIPLRCLFLVGSWLDGTEVLSAPDFVLSQSRPLCSAYLIVSTITGGGFVYSSAVAWARNKALRSRIATIFWLFGCSSRKSCRFNVGSPCKFFFPALSRIGGDGTQVYLHSSTLSHY